MNFAVEECAEDERELGENSSILCILDVSGLEEK